MGVHFDDFALPDEILMLPENKVLFREGDKGNEAYAVFDGGVGVYKNFDNSSKRKLLHIYFPGSIFGDYALLLDSSRSASAVTINHTNTKLGILSCSTYLEKFNKLSEEKRKEQINFIRRKIEKDNS